MIISNIIHMWLHHPHNTICRDLGFLKNLKTQGAGFTPKPDPPWMDVTSDTHPSIHSQYPSIHRASVWRRDGWRQRRAEKTWPSLKFDGFLHQCQNNLQQCFSLAMNLHPPCIDGYNLLGQNSLNLHPSRDSEFWAVTLILESSPLLFPLPQDGTTNRPGCVGLKVTLFDSLILSKPEELGLPFKPSSWRCCSVAKSWVKVSIGL